ncbi:MAG: O-antigen ligase family protein, partial [Gammaproteobacteria bacterium]
FIIVFIIYSQAYFYLWKAGMLPIMPGLWLATVSAMAIFSVAFSSGKTHQGREYYGRIHWQNQKALGAWAGVFGGIATFSYLFSLRDPEQLRALKTVIICMGMLGLYLAAFNSARAMRAARIAMVLVVLISVANNLLDFFGVYIFTIADGRGAGFYMNPNISSLYLLMGMILTVSLLSPRYRLMYCLIVAVGVLATFSRSGILVWLISVYGLGRTQIFHLSKRAITTMVIIMACAVLVMQLSANVVMALGLNKYLSENAMQRLHLNLSTDDSVLGRRAVAERSLELIKASPWVGYGLGAHSVPRTHVEPHNTYLLLGVELGLLGVAMYLWLLVVLWRMKSPVSKVFSFSLAVWSLFDHNLIDSQGLWLACAMLAGLTLTQKQMVPAKWRESREEHAVRKMSPGSPPPSTLGASVQTLRLP